MQIEAGKYYRTRDGRKAFVAAVRTDGEPELPIIGWIVGAAEWAWTKKGGADFSGRDHVFDLIAEWVEPVKVYLYERRHDGSKYVTIAAPPSYAVGDVLIGTAFVDPGELAEPSDAPA